MGYIAHHAILVVGFEYQLPGLRAAHEHARALFLDADQVGPVIEAPVNGHSWFCVGPDGGKEGREASKIGDSRRKAFREYLSDLDVSGCLDWAEIIMPEDGRAAVINDDED